MAEAAKVQQDGEALAQLGQSGVDLAKPQRLTFILRFQSEPDALTAAAQLDELAFRSTIEQDDAEGSWAVLAVKTMYAVESDLVGLREKLAVVATQNQGRYEGWRAATPAP